VYDPLNPEHEPRVKVPSSELSPKRRSRSLSPARSKSFLQGLADNIRNKASYFYESSEPVPTTPRSARSASSKKSVRFRFGHTVIEGQHEPDRTSSPIAIPQFSPSLPDLNVSKSPLLQLDSGLYGLTARPPSSLHLRVPGPESSPQSMTVEPSDPISALPTPMPGTNLPLEDPFNDVVVGQTTSTAGDYSEYGGSTLHESQPSEDLSRDKESQKGKESVQDENSKAGIESTFEDRQLNTIHISNLADEEPASTCYDSEGSNGLRLTRFAPGRTPSPAQVPLPPTVVKDADLETEIDFTKRLVAGRGDPSDDSMSPLLLNSTQETRLDQALAFRPLRRSPANIAESRRALTVSAFPLPHRFDSLIRPSTSTAKYSGEVSTATSSTSDFGLGSTDDGYDGADDGSSIIVRQSMGNGNADDSCDEADDKCSMICWGSSEKERRSDESNETTSSANTLTQISTAPTSARAASGDEQANVEGASGMKRESKEGWPPVKIEKAIAPEDLSPTPKRKTTPGGKKPGQGRCGGIRGMDQIENAHLEGAGHPFEEQHCLPRRSLADDTELPTYAMAIATGHIEHTEHFVPVPAAGRIRMEARNDEMTEEECEIELSFRRRRDSEES
jgi:hypothetical protein